MPPSTWMYALAFSTAPSKHDPATSAAKAHCSSSPQGDRSDVPGGRGDRLGGLEHLGAQVLDRLEGADLLAELLAHLGVVDRGRQAPAGHAGGLGGGQGDRGTRTRSVVSPGTGTPAAVGRPATVPKRRLRSGPQRAGRRRPRVGSTPTGGVVGQQQVRGRRRVPDSPSRVKAADDRALAECLGRRSRLPEQRARPPAEQRAGHQPVGARLERHGDVQHGATAAAGRLGQPDRRTPISTAGRPDVVERRVRVLLGGARRRRRRRRRPPTCAGWRPARRARRRSRSTCVLLDEGR